MQEDHKSFLETKGFYIFVSNPLACKKIVNLFGNRRIVYMGRLKMHNLEIARMENAQPGKGKNGK